MATGALKIKTSKGWVKPHTGGLKIVSAGGELANVKSTLLCTLESETSLADLFTVHPVPRKYDRSLVLIKITGTNVATSGSETSAFIMFYVDNVVPSNNRAAVSYVNGLSAPDGQSVFQSVYVKNTVTVETNGAISGLTVSGNYIAAGNSVYYLEVPFDFTDFEIDPFF